MKNRIIISMMFAAPENNGFRLSDEARETRYLIIGARFIIVFLLFSIIPAAIEL
jgi:hypothetical protein